jgi:hypothetical protein
MLWQRSATAKVGATTNLCKNTFGVNPRCLQERWMYLLHSLRDNRNPVNIPLTRSRFPHCSCNETNRDPWPKPSHCVQWFTRFARTTVNVEPTQMQRENGAQGLESNVRMVPRSIVTFVRPDGRCRCCRSREILAGYAGYRFGSQSTRSFGLFSACLVCCYSELVEPLGHVWVIIIWDATKPTTHGLLAPE